MFEYYCFDCGKYSYSATELENQRDKTCPYCEGDKIYYSPRELKRGIEGIINGIYTGERRQDNKD